MVAHHLQPAELVGRELDAVLLLLGQPHVEAHADDVEVRHESFICSEGVAHDTDDVGHRHRAHRHRADVRPLAPSTDDDARHNDLQERGGDAH